MSTVVMDDLTGVDRALLAAIKEAARQDGSAVSLFDVAVRRAGLNYWWALYRLRGLELLGYVRVDRSGPGRPLVMHPVDPERLT